MLVWFSFDFSSFTIAFWPLSHIRLCAQVVGVLRLRCPHGIFMFCWGVLVDVSLCDVVLFSCLICFFDVVLFWPFQDFLMGEFMLFCYTIYRMIFHAF